MQLKIRHLLRKGERFYFQPSKSMLAAGFKPEALGIDEAAAVARVKRFNDEWDGIRSKVAPEKAARGSMAWLIDGFQKSVEYQAWAPKTRYEFDRIVKIIGAAMPVANVAKIERRHVKGFHRKEATAVSVDHANRCAKGLYKLFQHAIDEGVIKVNPASRLKLKTPPPRSEVWEQDEVEGLIATAEAMGRASIGLAIRMAYDLGQSEIDVLTATWAQWDGQAFFLKRRKTAWQTQKLIGFNVLPSLQSAFNAAPKGGVQIVISEETGRPYGKWNFIRLFAGIRARAGLPKEKQFRDLRRSAAVRLAEAGATTEEIVAVTGHSIDHGAAILETYIPRNRKMAEAGLEKVRQRAGSGTKVGKPVGSLLEKPRKPD